MRYSGCIGWATQTSPLHVRTPSHPDASDHLVTDVSPQPDSAVPESAPPTPGPDAPAPAPSGSSTTLSKDLSDFLTELSVALHRRAMYPGGHPSLATAEGRVLKRLAPLLKMSGQLAVGIASEQLVIDGIATDAKNHLLRNLAQRLHGHHLAGFKLHTGVTGPEITGFLERLALDPKVATNEPITLPGSNATKWPHISAFRLSYERLELVEEDEAAFGGRKMPRAAQLWFALSQAAMMADAADLTAISADTDPGDVAKAMNARAAAQHAFEQVVVGYLLQIAEELKTSQSDDAAVLRTRVSKLVRALSPEAVKRLLEMGGDLAQRHAFLNDAAEGMAVEAVLTLTVAAAQVQQQAISKPLLRLLVKLASHSRRGPAHVRPTTDRAFRDNVHELIDGWYLPDPSSSEYGKVLDRMANPTPGPFSLGITQQAEPERVIEMCIEVRNAAPTLWDAVSAVISRGDIVMLLDTLDAAPADNPLPGVIRARIATPEYFARLLDTPAVDPKRLEEFARRVGEPATTALLEALAESQSRTTRRKLLDVLSHLGDSIGGPVVTRLPGAPWYIQRNLLILLGGLSKWPADFTPTPFASHADNRVRREAYRLMLRRQATREAAITGALGDPDIQIVRLAIDASQKDCPPAAVPRLVQRIVARSLPPDIEQLAVRTLAGTGAPEALPCLLLLAVYRTRWLRRERISSKSPAVLAALSGLATHWAADAHVAKIIGQASRSNDADIRGAVRSAA
jgi:hypothetical protein